MATKSVILVISVIINLSLQDISDNKIEDTIDPIQEAKDDILKEQTFQNVGGMLNSFMNSDGAQKLGDILSKASSGENAGNILQGVGSLLGQSKGIDPAMIGTVMNMFQSTGSKKNDNGMDMNMWMSLLGNVMNSGQSDDEFNFWSYLPTILQTANAFFGPEALEREKHHLDHSDLMPPVIEKLHLLFDHFINSQMGKNIINTLGAEKFVKIFADEKGRMSYRRFVDMLENHSFRKHWITMVTNKIAKLISHFSDPKTQKKYLTTFQHFINSVIKSQGYPKSTLFDSTRPIETLSSLFNYAAKDQLNMKIDSKLYVKPFVEYIQELFRLAEERGILNVNSRQLSNKLADTINLEVIEPIARVNRAFRFARKVPQCGRYVMCLVNHQPEDENPSLPGLKSALSKSSSLIYSWFLSSVTNNSYYSLYEAITGGTRCQELFVEACNDFHIEEIKVKQEVVHSEL